MLRPRKKVIVTSALIAAGLILLLVVGAFALRSSFYPKPRGLPPVVDQTTQDLLARLQLVLEKRATPIALSLQPGLSDAEITGLEAEGGFRLSDDLRALYRWRNGMRPGSNAELLPGHRFVPLQEAVSERAAVRGQVQSMSVRQRAAHSLFAGYRKNWLTVLTDEAGDGYFFDPKRTEKEGAFFCHFAEASYYVWFPSLRNFLAGAIDCFESGAVQLGVGKARLDEDAQKTQRIWSRVATNSPPAVRPNRTGPRNANCKRRWFGSRRNWTRRRRAGKSARP